MNKFFLKLKSLSLNQLKMLHDFIGKITACVTMMISKLCIQKERMVSYLLREEFFTRKRILIISCIAAAILVALIPTLLFINFVNSTKDYKNVLAVQDKEVITVHDDVYRPSVAEEVYSTPEPSQREKDLQLLNRSTGKGNVINILFLGIDRTEERDITIGPSRTDTITLASINMDTRKVEVLSIPRDTYVYIPCYGKKDKINHAYVWGGMGEKGIQSTIDTVNRFIKYSTVDYYFSIDMEPIPQIVDKLGGVELDVEIDMKDHGANLSKGYQLLDGKKAFDYIHWRYAGMGDIDRVKRQQKFAKAVVDKLRNSNQLVNSVSIVLGYNKNIKTNMTYQQMIALARLMMDIPSGNTNFYEINGRSDIIDKIWYWVPNEISTDKMLKKIFLLDGDS